MADNTDISCNEYNMFIKQKRVTEEMSYLPCHCIRIRYVHYTANFTLAQVKKINAFFTCGLRAVGNLNIKTSGLIKLNLGRKSIWRKLLLIKEKTIIKLAQETCTRKASYTIVVYKITVTREEVHNSLFLSLLVDPRLIICWRVNYN